MKLFVTGATGGIGQRLLPALIRAGHAVACLTRRSGSLPEGARPVAGDLLQPQAYAAHLAEADGILHLAALTHSGDPEAYFSINVEGTRRLVAAASGQGFAGRFVFMSTRAVGAACGAYGESKALAEDVVRRSGLSWTILRPGEVYGAGRGEAIDKLIRMVRRGPVVLLPGGNGPLLAPVHIDDVLEATLAALDAPAADGQVYTLAGPEEYTFAGLVAALEGAYGVRRLALRLPLGLLGLVSRIAWRFGLALPVVPDQIPRLRCPKSAGSEAARRDLGFCPRALRSALAQRQPD